MIGNSKQQSIMSVLLPEISIIIPIYNGGQWIDRCFQAIEKQDIFPHIPIEVSVFDDSSNDDTPLLLDKWTDKTNLSGLFSIINTRSSHDGPRGVGYAKNRAVENSRGQYLCFQDIDDEMEPCRLRKQLLIAKKLPNAIVGSQFTRWPSDSTARFTKWANSLPQNLLTVQVYTSHGPTVIMPTWFCGRNVFDRVGGFCEEGVGTPEDLIFFYKHLDVGGDVCRVDQPLIMYRYHPTSTTHTISEKVIWDLRLSRLEAKVLSNWANFTIWNAGKQGRRFWRSLSSQAKSKVVCFCDVDNRKIGKSFEPYLKEKESTSVRVPIKNFRDCSPPFVICVKMDLTNGVFENNLASLRLTEGIDFVMFS